MALRRIALVGDLSQQDPALLAKVLDAAIAAGADWVVQLGDIHGGDPATPSAAYNIVAERAKVLPIPGNHDVVNPTQWPATWPRQWRVECHDANGGDVATIIGLDNSADTIDDAGWKLLNDYAASPSSAPLFVCMHKSPSELVLPDGTESQHVMGEGMQDCLDRDKLVAWLHARQATVCCGHFHGQAIMRASYGVVLLEGRGGAAGPGNLGYTMINVQPEGWTAHPVSL